MLKYLLSFCLTIWMFFPSFGQLGGGNTFEFLNLTPSARVTGLGGSLIAVRDGDINLGLTNPGLLNPAMHHQLAFSHGFLPADIQHGYFAFGQHIEKLNTTFQGGVQYINYGAFETRDELNQLEGTFKASEFAVTLGAAYPVYDRLSLGVNAKIIGSNFESYNASALSADIAAVYYDTASNFTASLLVKNVGTQLSTYSEDNREPLPFDIQFGISKRLRHLPFRFSVVYHHLDRWNITYDDPNGEDDVLFLGEAPSQKSDFAIFADNLFRHFILNGEFLLGKRENLRVRFAYNHMMRKELQVDDFRSLGGFSFGFGFKVNRFYLDFGRMNYHLGGEGINQFGISTNLGDFKKRLVPKP